MLPITQKIRIQKIINQSDINFKKFDIAFIPNHCNLSIENNNKCFIILNEKTALNNKTILNNENITPYKINNKAIQIRYKPIQSKKYMKSLLDCQSLNCLNNSKQLQSNFVKQSKKNFTDLSTTSQSILNIDQIYPIDNLNFNHKFNINSAIQPNIQLKKNLTIQRLSSNICELLSCTFIKFTCHYKQTQPLTKLKYVLHLFFFN